MLANQMMVNSPSLTNLKSMSRLEGLILVILILAGFALRTWQISSAGLDHFDEGVYVFSALGLTDSNQPHRLYPEQIKFSPPVFFSLVGLAYYLLGTSDLAAILLNILLGTLTIALIWWVGRSWFGPSAGLTAAALLAFSQYHIAFSRTALTDVAFALFFLLALALIVVAMERQSFGWAIVAGLAVGLAWNTKYHGWFALAAAGAALLPFTWYRYSRGQSVVRFFLLWGVMAAVAVACYLPWAVYVQMQPGGYAALTQYQRTLIHPRDWVQSLWQQAQQQLLFEGLFSRASVLAAALCGLLISNPGVRVRPRFLLLVVFLAVSSLLIGASGTATLLGLLALPMALRRPASYSTWLILGWLGLWFFSTPLYHPYARLVLPFTLATNLVAGWWLARMMTEPTPEIQLKDWRSSLVVAVAAMVVVVGALAIPNPSNPWRSSRSMAEAAVAMQDLIPAGSRVIVIGEPALAFYLHLANRPAFERVENPAALESIETPVYVVTGVYTKRAPTLREGLEKLGDRLVPLETFPVVPSDIRILDDFRPQEASRFRTSPDETFALTLYTLEPKSTNVMNNPE